MSITPHSRASSPGVALASGLVIRRVEVDTDTRPGTPDEERARVGAATADVDGSLTELAESRRVEAPTCHAASGSRRSYPLTRRRIGSNVRNGDPTGTVISSDGG